jgi:hypothetical protein
VFALKGGGPAPSTGSCGGSYLCTGTTGHDGSAGLGTLNRTGAF